MVIPIRLGFCNALYCVIILGTLSACTRGPVRLHTYRSSPLVTDINVIEGQEIKKDHLSTSLRFFSLPLGIGPPLLVVV